MIRPYTSADKPALITLLQLNIPAYFAPSEEQDFSAFLDRHVDSYFVVENAGKLIGAGGINFFMATQQAYLSWDIIHPDFQGQGIGSQLTSYRIAQIRKNPRIRQIIVRTTQLVYPFYEKMGFTLEKTGQDYWAKGFDLYYMVMAV